jgi:hypothetical protein
LATQSAPPPSHVHAPHTQLFGHDGGGGAVHARLGHKGKNQREPSSLTHTHPSPHATPSTNGAPTGLAPRALRVPVARCLVAVKGPRLHQSGPQPLPWPLCWHPHGVLAAAGPLPTGPCAWRGPGPGARNIRSARSSPCSHHSPRPLPRPRVRCTGTSARPEAVTVTTSASTACASAATPPGPPWLSPSSRCCSCCGGGRHAKPVQARRGTGRGSGRGGGRGQGPLPRSG